jgi:1,4-dihydroxy-2-naphthoate octaprenyltransferase
VRLVASGLATPRAVKRAALLSFLVAAAAGTALALATTPWLFVVGALSIAAGWLYTGGPRPYGYYGLGELFVFVFFGLVATVGSTFVQIERITGLSVACACAVGLAIVALLVANNLRDIPTDRATGKRTLAVRLGEKRTRALYVVLVIGALLVAALTALDRPPALLAVVSAIFATRPLQAVVRGARGRQLIPVLVATGRFNLVVGVLFAVGQHTSRVVGCDPCRVRSATSGRATASSSIVWSSSPTPSSPSPSRC